MRLLTDHRSRARALAVAALVLAAGCSPCHGPDPAGSGDGGFDPAPALAALEARGGEAALAAARAEIARAARTAAPHELADRVEDLASELWIRGEAAASEAMLVAALDLRARAPDSDLEALAGLLHDLSTVVFERGELESAERYERRSVELWERAGAPHEPRLAESRRDLGFIYLSQGRLAESEPLLVDALAVLERAAGVDWTQVAIARDYLATLRRVQGDYDRAERMYAVLLPEALTRLGEDHPQVAYYENNLAGIYRDQERFDRAEELLHRSLARRRAADPPDPAAIARATLNLAELYRFQGKADDAEPLYREALATADEVWDRASSERLEFVNQLAVLLRETGRAAEAEPLAREALGLAVAGLGPDHPRVAFSELDLAELLRVRGRPGEALAHADRAVAIREGVFGPDHPEVAAALVARTTCLAADPRRSREARASLDRAVAILARSAAYPGTAADALALRAELRRAAEPAAARADLAAALDAVEALRPSRGGGEAVRAEYLGARAELYERFARWEVEDGSPERGFLAAERGRGRALLDQLAAARVGEDTAAQPEAAAALAAARAGLAEARARIAFVEAREDLAPAARASELARLADRLDEASRAFRAAWDRARNASPAWRASAASTVASVERVRAEAVPRNGLLLFYATGEDGSLAFVVAPGPAPVEAFPLALDARDAAELGAEPGPLTRRALERALLGADGVLAALGAPPLGASRARGIGGLAGGAPVLASRLAALRRALVPEPLRERVARAAEVVLVVDGPLAALPFEALVTRAGEDAAATRFWIDDGPPVRYASSATLLVELAGAGRARAAVAALSVSDPDYGPPAAAASDAPRASSGFRARGLPRLPGTAAETRAVARALDGLVEVVTLDRAEAREPAVRHALAGKRFIHLAAHGMADRDAGGLFAALALTPPPGAGTPDDDGLLELHEIYGLDLDADLVVLSSCGSNVGRSVAGEGVFALSRGFLVAGAGRVVASQWPVDDDTSAGLVGALFEELAAAERAGTPGSVAAALANAKRAVRNTPGREHPFFWAPFVLAGGG